jgi:hypothetical protein
MSELTDAVERLSRANAEAIEFHVEQMVGVELHRPWWMPIRAYRWLLRTIHVKTTAPIVTTRRK